MDESSQETPLHERIAERIEGNDSLYDLLPEIVRNRRDQRVQEVLEQEKLIGFRYFGHSSSLSEAESGVYPGRLEKKGCVLPTANIIYFNLLMGEVNSLPPTVVREVFAEVYGQNVFCLFNPVHYLYFSLSACSEWREKSNSPFSTSFNTTEPLK